MRTELETATQTEREQKGGVINQRERARQPLTSAVPGMKRVKAAPVTSHYNYPVLLPGRFIWLASVNKTHLSGVLRPGCWCDIKSRREGGGTDTEGF